MTKKIYLAGPEVFLSNAREMLEAKASSLAKLASRPYLLATSKFHRQIPRQATAATSTPSMSI